MTGRTRDRSSLTQHPLHIFNDLKLFSSEHALLSTFSQADILLYLFSTTHATQDCRYFSLMPEPVQRPGHHSPLQVDPLETFSNHLGKSCKIPSLKGFHNHHCQTPRSSVFHPFYASLEVNIEIIILHLAEGPRVSIDNAPKGLFIIVKRETKVADISLLSKAVRPLENLAPKNGLPPALVESMNKVEVNVVDLKPPELFSKVPFKITRRVDESDGELCSHLNFLAISPF